MNVAIGFISFLLRDSNSYNVSKDDVGTVLSTTGFMAELMTILIDFFLGPLYDIVGRKWPVIIG